jgi:hypothetical protein
METNGNTRKTISRMNPGAISMYGIDFDDMQ